MAREDGRDLDGRKRTILHAVILEYVGGAEPVGSELLTQKYELGVRSATVRNELAEMSELGYLEQPHTSAGRIPSDLGYRYYVDHLVIDKAVDEAVRQEIQRHTHEGETLQGLLTDTVRVMSRMTHLLGVATTVRGLDVTVRTVMVSAMGPTQALLVLALSNGHIENRMVECPAGLTLEDLGRANEVLTATFVGRTLKQATRVKMPAVTGFPLAERMLQPVVAQVRAITRDLTRGKVITDGEEFMLAQPEFRSDIRGLADMLDEIISSDVLYESVAPGERTQPVVIGKENRHPQMWRFSIVRNSFFVGEHEAGVVALVGPTRLAYESGIPLVNYTAQLLSTSLTRYFAQGR